jgi:hypothetical protein
MTPQELHGNFSARGRPADVRFGLPVRVTFVAVGGGLVPPFFEPA